MWKGATPAIFSYAKDLRNNMTSAEVLLWDRLSSNKFQGLKFRRQHPIANYVADFYCHKLKLIIEVDGEYHENIEQLQKDKERTENLEFNGIEVLRFTNNQIENKIEEVLACITSFISSTNNLKE